jgi:16S rRNA (cytidine1402-2'-O)-methyltransferase
VTKTAATRSGSLYLVATPIGNLEDVTLRAIRTLREADVIACEDTRRTRGLLARHDIHIPLLSLHEHNERARVPQIIRMLDEGKDVALVSDAGTPTISDPGATLINAAVAAGHHVVAVPGPSAVTAAIGLADFPAASFAFVGFLPRRRVERARLLASLAPLPMALVFFEAPHRIRATLAELEDALGPRRVALARELTKVHEEVLRGTVAEVRARLDEAPRGEVTLVVEGFAGAAAPPAGARAAADPGAPEAFVRRLIDEGLSRRDAARAASAAFAMPPREAYRLAHETKRGET